MVNLIDERDANVSYSSEALVKYFQSVRRSWDEFYPSEKRVFEYLQPNSTSKVLDMGCGCGGLGNALKERFGVTSYIGVDINSQCITEAKKRHPWATFYQGDFLEVQHQIEGGFDLAISLSCADWNVRTIDLWSSLFKKVKDGGSFVFSCRLTNDDSINDQVSGLQKFSWPVGSLTPDASEDAPYKVFRLHAILSLLMSLGEVSRIYLYGYWGNVPDTVKGIGLQKVFYAVIAVQKNAKHQKAAPPQLEFHGAADFFI